MTDGLTLLAHAEGGDNLAMAGLGATFRIAHRGTATLSFAQSRTRDRNGSLMDLSTELSLGRMRLSGRIMATQGDFTDIAALSADPDLAEPLLPDFPGIWRSCPFRCRWAWAAPQICFLAICAMPMTGTRPALVPATAPGSGATAA